MAGATCRPPRGVTVKSYVRKRRRAKPKAKAGITYWVATNGRESCGHKHRKALAAHKCATRNQRLFRRKYGVKSGGRWDIEKRTTR